MTSAVTELGTIAVLIPAWRPGRELISLVHELEQRGFTRIVVVNDGSGPEFDTVFAALPNVDLLRHPANRGKGAALKTGVSHILQASPEVIGIVTADADGQHLPDDILRVARSLVAHPECLVLGSRAFSGHVPLRSRVGNTVIRHLTRIVGGLALRDTQTGLRGIPSAFAAELSEIEFNGYEFELAMLIAARQNGTPIFEEPIQTVYEPGNSSSHFNPLRDSIRVCSVLLRLAIILSAAGVLDILAFRAAIHFRLSLLEAHVLGCAVAAAFTLSTPIYRSARVAKRFAASAILLGAVSFGFIELVVNIHLLPQRRAKLWVEVFLFLVNLAVQRDWVFRRQTPAVQPVASFRWKSLPLWLLLGVPVVIEVIGFRSAHLSSLDLWLPDGIGRFGTFTVLAAAAAVVFGFFATRWFLAAFTAAIVGCSIYAVGIAPVATVLLFVFSTTVLGRLLAGPNLAGPLAMAAGLAVWIALLNLTARLPLHYAAVDLAALTLPLGIGFRHTRRLALEWLSLLRPRNLLPSEFLAAALAAFALTASWLVVLAPEISADGLAMHLTIAADIALHHAFTIGFQHFVWALMPMGGDFCYAVVYTLGGEYAARLLNFALLTGTALLIFQAVRSFLSTSAAALLAALFLSTPVAWLVTGSLFIENFVAFMTLAAVSALWRFYEGTRSPADLFLAALLAGASASLKVGALAVALPAIAILFVLARRTRILAVAALALALTLGAIPYANAWRQTGNPFFPYANAFSRSQSVAIRDRTYRQPLSWRTPYDLTFATNRYFEGQRGSFGFQYLLFLPLLAAGAITVRAFRGRTAILLGLASAVTIAAVQPNARYLYFATPVLAVGTAASLAWIRARDYRLFQAAIAAASAGLFANLWFLPAADWYHRDFYTAPLFSEAGRAKYLHDLAPVREVTGWINRTHPAEPVVMIDSSDIAGLLPPVYINNWHNYSFVQQINAAVEPDDVFHVFHDHQIERMVINKAKHKTPAADQFADQFADPHSDPLGALIAACGEPEFVSGSIASLHIRADCATLSLAARCPAREPIVSGPSFVDETDPRIGLLGGWARRDIFPLAWNKTVSYSNVPGALVCMTIEGTGFDYIYTRAFNRGIAEVVVDSRKAAIVDLYSPTTVWQAKTTISGLTPGPHRVSILVLNKKRPEATDSYVDLDAVRVF